MSKKRNRRFLAGPIDFLQENMINENTNELSNTNDNHVKNIVEKGGPCQINLAPAVSTYGNVLAVAINIVTNRRGKRFDAYWVPLFNDMEGLGSPVNLDNVEENYLFTISLTGCTFVIDRRENRVVHVDAGDSYSSKKKIYGEMKLSNETKQEPDQSRFWRKPKDCAYTTIVGIRNLGWQFYAQDYVGVGKPPFGMHLI